MLKAKLKYKFMRVFMTPLIIGTIFAVILTYIIIYVTSKNFLLNNDGVGDFVNRNVKEVNSPVILAAKNHITQHLQRVINGFLQIKKSYNINIEDKSFNLNLVNTSKIINALDFDSSYFDNDNPKYNPGKNYL